MKKNLLLIIALFVATTMSAQFYAGLGVGYALGASKRVNGTETSGTITTNIYGSYGQGFAPTLKLGFMFSDNMGIEMGVSYLMGASQTKLKTSSELEEAKSNGMRLAPQLVYQLDNGFYGRFGVIIPVMGKTVITSTDDSVMVGLNTYAKKEMEIETKGSFSIGFIGAIGYNYALSDNMNLFGEIEYIGLSIKSGSATVTKLDLGGTDLLEKMDTYRKEIEFVDEIDSSTKFDKDKPTQMLKQKAPFSSFGLNVGITMTF